MESGKPGANTRPPRSGTFSRGPRKPR
jgi:hypothetical protein